MASKLTDFITPNDILTHIVATDKFDAIDQIVDFALRTHGLIHEKEAILQSVVSRERQRSTGIGSGFACPHGKTNLCPKTIVSIGKLDTPIVFDSIDNQEVWFLCLVLSPFKEIALHIKMMAACCHLVKNSDIIAKIKSCDTSQPIFDLILQNDFEGLS